MNYHVETEDIKRINFHTLRGERILTKRDDKTNKLTKERYLFNNLTVVNLKI